MSDVITVSATEARNNFFELLNMVLYGKKIVMVEKNKMPAVRIIRAETKSWKELEKALDKTYGIWRDVPEKEFKRMERFVRGPKEKRYMRNLAKGAVR